MVIIIFGVPAGRKMSVRICHINRQQNAGNRDISPNQIVPEKTYHNRA